MAAKISVVANTLNEEKNIAQALKSVEWASEILVCDMYSDDKTVEIAKKLGAKVIMHKRMNYVEPARNFAISNASNEWILVLDPDEEIPASLAKRLQAIAQKMKEIDFVRVPRKNIIFNKWIKNDGWWPDLNIRFFRKGKVKWTDNIHRPPQLQGEGLDLDADEKWAIIHHNYQTIGQFIERMNRYTSVEAESLIKEGYKFDWRDLLRKPMDEFLSRYFANKGYADGMHGLALSLLQAVSFLTVCLKVWELSGLKEDTIEIAKMDEEKKRAGNALDYWIKHDKHGNSLKDFFKKFI